MNAPVPLALEVDDTCQNRYHYLRVFAAAGDLPELLARMLSAQAAGFGTMPLRLGLSPADFDSLFTAMFRGADPDRFTSGMVFPESRNEEQEELLALFAEHAGRPESPAFATILCAGCMGSDHLWQDLGLWSRQDLSLLIGACFPTLKTRNDRDMKWKKFFYKQLWEREGVYTCRAPSCNACADYRACFGPEE